MLKDRMYVWTNSVELVREIEDPTRAKMEIQMLILDIVCIVRSLDYFCISKVPRLLEPTT